MTQFEEPVDEEAAYFAEIACESCLAKPREPIAEQQESLIYLQNPSDKEHGVVIVQNNHTGVQVAEKPKDYVYKSS